MSPKFEEEYQKAALRFILIPIFALFGIYFSGELIQAFFEVPDAAKKLFWAIGGIAFFAWYFRVQIKGFMGR